LPTGTTDYKDGHDYFRVEADGIFNGSRRKVQAILVTEDLGLPKAYFSTENIDFDGGASATDVSFFAKGNITGVKCGTVTGADNAYGDWSGNYNNKVRLDSTRTAAVDPGAAGIAAEGSITYASGGPGCGDFDNNQQHQSPAAKNDFYKRRDFDGLTSYPGGLANPSTLTPPDPNYRFCREGTAGCWTTGTSQPADVITYPFKPDSKLNAEFLTIVAKGQVRPGVGPVDSRDNYYTASSGTYNLDESKFLQVSPAPNSVYVVEFTGSTGGEVKFETNAGSCLKGTILVINGDFTTNNAGDKCFDGILSVQRNAALAAAEDLVYKNAGNFTLNGFMNIQGSMEIKGGVSPLLGGDVLNSPGYHNVKIWSWRECYNTACN